MEKKINFNETEINELVQVLSLCEPSIGYIGDHLYRTIITFFRKTYKTELGFMNISGTEYISDEKCIVYSGKHKISTKEIINELKDRNKLVQERIQIEDFNGNKESDNGIPRYRRVFKILNIK